MGVLLSTSTLHHGAYENGDDNNHVVCGGPNVDDDDDDNCVVQLVWQHELSLPHLQSVPLIRSQLSNDPANYGESEQLILTAGHCY